MNFNFSFHNADAALPVLMSALLKQGKPFGSRAGMTKELMHVGITLDKPWQRELTLPERKASIAAQVVETMWVLGGRNDVGGLLPYLPRAADFSDDGVNWRAGYGQRLRNYHGVDQLAYLVDTLRDNASSRQAVATIWDPTVDTEPGKDIACNNWLSFSCRDDELDLHVAIRSNDAMWGWSGINAFEWSALLEIVAGLAGIPWVGRLHFSTTSFHLYETHWAKAERISNSAWWTTSGHDDSPRFEAPGLTMDGLDQLIEDWFYLEGLIRTGDQCITGVNGFPEPMMQSWLRVLQWYWSGDETFLAPLIGTRLHAACLHGMAPAGKPQPAHMRHVHTELPERERFLAAVNRLHADKHAAYGDSWKRRGEAGILGNIARKIDRIGTGQDTTDETQSDTAIDLMVYLAKYRCWLHGWEDALPEEVANVLADVPERKVFPGNEALFERFERLEEIGPGAAAEKLDLVDQLLELSMALARSLWKS